MCEMAYPFYIVGDGLTPTGRGGTRGRAGHVTKPSGTAYAAQVSVEQPHHRLVSRFHVEKHLYRS